MEGILAEITPASRRSRSNHPVKIPYSKKSANRDTTSDFGNESTTIGMASEMDSPLIMGNAKRQGLSLDPSRHLDKVSEYPQSANHNYNRKNSTYRKQQAAWYQRLMDKGCYKLLKMAKAHDSDLDKHY